MPYRVEHSDMEAPAQPGAFLLRLRLWPHSSLSGNGFVWTIALLYTLLSIPMLALLGTSALWGVLPFELAAVALLWFALKRSWRDREITETFELTRDAATLTRREPDGRVRDWTANPYWLQAKLHPKDGPVEDYLTLEGGPRAVEIGAFLTPEERRALHDLLQGCFGAVRAPV